MEKFSSGIEKIWQADGCIHVKSDMAVSVVDADSRFGGLLEMVRALRQSGRPVLLLVDFSGVTRVNFASRRRLLKLYKEKPDRMAYFGTIFRVELLLTAIARVVGFRRIGFFKTEAEAKRFLKSDNS